MKHNRVLAFVLSLLLLWLPAAQATDHIANFHQPEGVEMYALEDAKNMSVPSGLQEMYDLFAQGNRAATVYVFRMPNGRALLSVSCMEMDQPGETQQLYEQRQELATQLFASMGDQLTGEPVFALEKMYGQEALVSTMTLNTQSGTLEAKVTFFYRGEDLMEVWTMHPVASRYLFDDDAAAQLEEDLGYLKDFEDSLDFTVPDEDTPEPKDDNGLSSVLDYINSQDIQSISDDDQPAQSISSGDQTAHMTVTADDGSFRMDVPVDTVVVHAGSDESIIARARTLFADVKGGVECFDIWFEEVTESDGWLLISRQAGVVAQVYVNDAGNFAGMDAETMLQLEGPVLDMMKESYEHAELADESSIETLDGMEHVWFTYDIRTGDMDLLSFVLAAVEDQTLYEIDVYILVDEDVDVDETSEIVIMMLESLDYQPSMDI